MLNFCDVSMLEKSSELISNIYCNGLRNEWKGLQKFCVQGRRLSLVLARRLEFGIQAQFFVWEKPYQLEEEAISENYSAAMRSDFLLAPIRRIQFGYGCLLLANKRKLIWR